MENCICLSTEADGLARTPTQGWRVSITMRATDLRKFWRLMSTKLAGFSHFKFGRQLKRPIRRTTTLLTCGTWEMEHHGKRPLHNLTTPTTRLEITAFPFR